MDDVTERWLPAPEWEGLYEVSDRGRTRSLPRKTASGRRGGRLLTPDKRPDGHLKVSLSDCGRRRKVYVHQLVMLAFVGPYPPGMEIRHLNGDPEDNRLENLAYGTKAENAADRIAHGRDAHARNTHCPSGHEFTPENTARHRRDSSRYCKICNRSRSSENYRTKFSAAARAAA